MASIPIPQLTAALFVQTASAAQQAQQRLDRVSATLPRSYSIPRVAVRAKFSVTEIHGKTFIVFGEKTEEQHENQVNFELNLAPDRVLPVPAPASLPETAAQVPPFIVPPTEHARLIQSLKNHLTALDPDKYSTELRKIDQAFASRTSDPGFVFLALNNSGRYLLIRLGGRNDGIFLMDEGTPGDFQVISYWGLDSPRVQWSLFHELFNALRDWQRDSLPGRVVAARDLPDKFGQIDVSEFSAAIWSGYCKARQELATVATDDAAFPAFYELRDVSALLTYSVPSDEGGLEDTTPFIRSQVSIAIDDADLNVPRMSVDLIAPEFVLVNDARKSVLDHLSDNLLLDASDRDCLWSVIDTGYQADYKAAFADTTRRNAALVTLSYRDQPPRNQFLFVWTGTIDDEEREFAFRLRYNGERLADPMLVLPLQDPTDVSAAGIPSGQIPFAGAQVNYNSNHPALHDFFHAIWIWTLSGDWF